MSAVVVVVVVVVVLVAYLILSLNRKTLAGPH
jgi:hypothetical protein